MDIRKLAISITLAVLLAIFIQATITAFYKEPTYDQFCKNSYAPYSVPIPYQEKQPNCTFFVDASTEVKDNCTATGGSINYIYDSHGCVSDYKCDMCSANFETAMKKHSLLSFLIAAVLGLIAIIVGLILPTDDDLNEWVGAGLIMGGLFAIFFSTVKAYTYISDILKPFVILAEIILVVVIAYRKLSEKKKFTFQTKSPVKKKKK